MFQEFSGLHKYTMNVRDDVSVSGPVLAVNDAPVDADIVAVELPALRLHVGKDQVVLQLEPCILLQKVSPSEFVMRQEDGQKAVRLRFGAPNFADNGELREGDHLVVKCCEARFLVPQVSESGVFICVPAALSQPNTVMK